MTVQVESALAGSRAHPAASFGRPAASGWVRWTARLCAIVVALGIWELIVDSGAVDRSALSSPTDVVRALGGLAGDGVFWSAVGNTAYTWALGLAIALVAGVSAGIALGSSSIAYRLSRFTIDFLRTIPPVALIPLTLLLYGARIKMAVVLIVFGTVWPILLQTMYGVHDVDPVARDVARSYRWRRRDVVGRLIIPSAAPFIATGIRIGATMGLLLAVGSELIGGAPGIGEAISLQQEGGNIPEVYAYIVVSAVLGVIVNLGLHWLERKVLLWHSAYR
jgi:ABC-type nitrate/sulfonate/bicarbonate transport system permease component